MRSKRSIWKRGLAVCLMVVLAFMFSATPLYESQVQAAEVKAGTEYIKELRLFITKKNNSLAEAENGVRSRATAGRFSRAKIRRGSSIRISQRI